MHKLDKEDPFISGHIHMNLSGPVGHIVPVSYTHLDVYKRQSYNLAVEFNAPAVLDSLPLMCILSFSLQDDTDPDEVADLFRKDLLASIALARSTKKQTPASTAVLKAAKRVQDTFHCECFMLEADATLNISLC